MKKISGETANQISGVPRLRLLSRKRNSRPY